MLALLSSAALAQASGSVALLSDYRYRGVSLSQGKPAAQLTGAYDDPAGWFAGGALSAVLARCFRACGGVQGVAYAGYAARQPSGLAFEAGADYRFGAATRDYRFAEAFVGTSYRDTSARLFYAPRYFGQDVQAVYAELNQAFPIGHGIRLLAHVGVLHTGSPAYGVPSTTRADVLLGGALELGSVELQLTWQHAEEQPATYPTYPNERRNAWVLVLSHVF